MVTIFCDGACSGNPGPGGWAAIAASPHEVFEIAGHEVHTTNNQMELMASIYALEGAQSHFPGLEISLHTDSKYVIEGITSWIHGWKKRGWVKADGKPVLHQHIWEKLDLLNSRASVTWIYVAGHKGIPGNDRCDELAVKMSKGEKITLYAGSRDRYPVSLEIPDVSQDPWYVSVLEGSVVRHKSWAACEAHVKGKRGAKFKKVHNSLEEGKFLESLKKI